MSLGQAYIDVRANTSGFAEGLKLEVLKAIVQAQALADANAIKIRTTTSGGGSGSSGSSNPFAAANEEALRDLRQHTAELAAAESEAYKESIQRAKDAAADIDQSFGEASQGAKDFGIDLGNLKIPAIVAAASLAVIAAAAVGAGTALSVLGIKSAETIRTLTLQLTDTGESAKQAGIQIQALQGLAAQGLDLSALASDQQQLDALGLSAKASTGLLKILGDTFAGEGFVGAALQSQVDAATKTLSSVIGAGAATKTTIKDVSDALGVSQAAVRHELGLTSAQLDALITKGKVSAASIANAGIAVATGLPNTSGGLANAAASSPTQAIAALKSQLESAIAGAFAGPDVAEGIQSIGNQLTAFVTKVAPSIERDTVAVLKGVSEAIGPVSDFLAGALTDIGNLVSEAIDPTSQLHEFLVDVFDDAKDIGQILVPVLEGVAGAIKEAVEGLKPVLDAVAAFAQTSVGSKLLEAAGAITAVAVAVKLFTGLAGLVDGVRVALIGLAGVTGLGEVAAGADALAASLGGIAVGALPEIAAAAVVAYGTYKAAVEIATDKTNDNAKALDANGQSLSSFGNINDRTAGQVDSLGRVITNASVGAATSVQALTSSLYALPTSVPINVDISVTTSTGKANELIGGLSGRQQNAAQLAAGGTDSALSAGDQLQEQLAKITNAFKGFSGSNGGGSGGGVGSSAAASAAKAIADATATFKTSLGDFTTAIGGAQTIAAVDSAFQSLQSAIDAEDKALGKKEPTGLATYLTKQKAALDKAASELQLGLSERAQFLGDATVAAANPNVAGISGIISQLNGQLARSTEFSADLKKLQKEGLNQTALSQLLALGPTSAGLQAASDLIQATASQISQINSVQTQIGQAGESLGTSLAANFKDAGTQAAQGLIDGLKSAEPALEAQMSKLADTMSSTIKKGLGIHSPSTVFRDHGINVVKGLVQGIQSAGTPTVPIPGIGRAGAGALGGNTSSVTFGPGSIVVNSADPSNPSGTGNAIAMAIADVLAARSMAATFSNN